MKKIIMAIVIIAVLLPVAAWAQCGNCASHDKKSVTMDKSDKTTLPGYNKKIDLPDGKYFTYNFTKKPKLGASILKVSIFDKKGRLSDDYDVFITADMPSMRGAHASGDTRMKANKKGDLLAPVNFVMPGIWEVEMKFMKDGKQPFCGCFELKI